MSTDTSVPHPRVSGVEGQPMDVSDSALYATLMKEAPAGFAFFDTGLRCRRANEALERLLGVPARDLQQRRPAEVLPEAVATAFEAALRKVLAEDRPLTEVDLPVAPPTGPGAEPGGPPPTPVEAPLAPASGTHDDARILTCAWLPAHGRDGKLIGVVLTALDVTERRRTEEIIRRKEQRYRSLVEASSQVVWVSAPDGTVIDDAPEWRAITGQPPEDYATGGWLAVVHPEDRPRIESIWRECVQENRIFETSYRVRTKTGTFRHFDVRAVPIWQGDVVIEWVGANTDVTGQREAEEMRGRLTEQLSAAALRTARLQQATSMLAEALTVSQVVQVITEVGRSAIGADYSAVALLDDDKLRLSIVTPSPPGAEGEGTAAVRGEDIKVSDQTVMSVSVRESRPFLAEHPDSLRLQLGRDETGLFLQHTEERAWVGLPLLAAGAPIGALRFSFTRPREITEEERVFL
jgi:PAS domain S-box-containing protein